MGDDVISSFITKVYFPFLAGVIAVGAILSPILVPVSMVVGAVALPIFAAKAACHKTAYSYYRNKAKDTHGNTLAPKKITANTSIYSNDKALLKMTVKQLTQQKKMYESIHNIKSSGICMIPFGVYHLLFSRNTSTRVHNLNALIKETKKHAN